VGFEWRINVREEGASVGGQGEKRISNLSVSARLSDKGKVVYPHLEQDMHTVDVEWKEDSGSA